jgi:hypothetical protein
VTGQVENVWVEARRRSLQQLSVAAARLRGGESADGLISLIRDHVDNHYVKAAAIHRIGGRHSWAAVEDPLQLAATLDLRALPRRARTGRWWRVPKANGDRTVCSLSWPLRVAHSVVAEALQRTHMPGDHVGDWIGRGPDYHVRRLCDDLHHGDLLFLADVRNCFSSVSPDAVYGLGYLPSDLVEACLDSRRIRLRAPREVRVGSIARVSERTGQFGLMTGIPAASILWAIMIDDLPVTLPDGVRAHTYADNIAITCQSKQDCDEAEAALIQYFVNHWAGPFDLKLSRPDVENGFDHLGYNISVRDGATSIWVKDSKLPALTDRIWQEIEARDRCIFEDEVERIAAGYASPWPMLSSDCREIISEEVKIASAWRNARLSRRRI